MGQLELSIIIPLFNEEDNVQPLYDRLCETIYKEKLSFEVILIDDGSKDQTYSLLKQIADQDSHIKVIHFRKNFGQTAAMSAGIEHATGDIIVPMDGDLQNDPADIPVLLEKLNEGFDVVSGWRKNRKDPFFTRTLPSNTANALISLISGVHLHDYGCSLKAYRRDVLEQVHLYGEMHRFIPIYAHWQGGKITEMPVTHHPRLRGESKYGLMRIFKVILDLMVIKFLASYMTRPIHMFGGIGLFFISGAFLAGTYALYLKFFQGVSFILTPLPLLTVLLSMLGIMCILMGLNAELLMRTYHESQDKKIYAAKEKINF